MKKTSLNVLLVIMFLIICLSACDNTTIVDIPLGNEPTKTFSVFDYLDNGAIIQESKAFTIKGTSEKDVVIVVSLYDNHNTLIYQSYGITDEKGNWIATINAPKASSKTYSIVINDAGKKYTKMFTNILFGKVWLLAGEDFISEKIDLSLIPESFEELENIKFYKQGIKKGEWITNKTFNEVTSLAYYYALALTKKYNDDLSYGDMPIAIIMLGDEENYLYEWLSVEMIDRVKYVKEYLLDKDLYVDKDPTDGEMSYLYNNLIQPLMGISLTGVIWSQGLSDLKYKNTTIDDHFSIYQLLLNIFFNSLCNNFGNQIDILVIQTPSINIEGSEILREAQSKVSFFFNNTKIIPTYDLYDDKIILNEEIEEIRVISKYFTIDINKLVERLIDIHFNEKKVSSYAKLIIKRNDDNIITNITIYFSNTNRLRSDDFNSFLLYGKDNEILEIKPTINHDMIEIDLQESLKVIGEEITYYEIKRITYAYEMDITNCDLYNNYNIPVIPFKIDIGGE